MMFILNYNHYRLLFLPMLKFRLKIFLHVPLSNVALLLKWHASNLLSNILSSKALSPLCNSIHQTFQRSIKLRLLKAFKLSLLFMPPYHKLCRSLNTRSAKFQITVVFLQRRMQLLIPSVRMLSNNSSKHL